MFVNYVREINAFHRYANDNYLNSGERLLWFGLMDYINSRVANGAEWPGEYVSIPNKGLLSHVPFGEDALIDARNRLKQRGLLEYIPGKKNKEAPKYKIHYFEAKVSTSYQQDFGDCYPENQGNVPGKLPGKLGGNVPGKLGGNLPGNMPGKLTHINPNVNPDRNPDVYTHDDDDEAEERARTVAREAVDSAFREHFGRSATVAEANRIALVFVNLGMEIDVLREAVRTAAQNGARVPAMYVLRLLEEWSREYIRTASDLDDYRVMRDMHFGHGPFPAETVSFSEMQDARERRREAAQTEKAGW